MPTDSVSQEFGQDRAQLGWLISAPGCLGPQPRVSQKGLEVGWGLKDLRLEDPLPRWHFHVHLGPRLEWQRLGFTGLLARAQAYWPASPASWPHEVGLHKCQQDSTMTFRMWVPLSLLGRSWLRRDPLSQVPQLGAMRTIPWVVGAAGEGSRNTMIWFNLNFSNSGTDTEGSWGMQEITRRSEHRTRSYTAPASPCLLCQVA